MHDVGLPTKQSTSRCCARSAPPTEPSSRTGKITTRQSGLLLMSPAHRKSLNLLSTPRRRHGESLQTWSPMESCTQHPADENCGGGDGGPGATPQTVARARAQGTLMEPRVPNVGPGSEPHARVLGEPPCCSYCEVHEGATDAEPF